VSLPGGGRQKSDFMKGSPVKSVRSCKPCSRVNRIWPVDGDWEARPPPILRMAPIVLTLAARTIYRTARMLQKSPDYGTRTTALIWKFELLAST
jgi:hypothetical protein